MANYKRTQKLETKEKPETQISGAAAQRLRPGVVPDWAKAKILNDSAGPQAQEITGFQQNDQKGLRFTGMTAAGDAMVIDTTHTKRSTQNVLTNTVYVVHNEKRQAALEKMLKLQEQQEQNSDDDDLFGDEEDEAPVVVNGQKKEDLGEIYNGAFASDDEIIQTKKDSSESESDEDIEDKNALPLARPVFVSKADRQLLSEATRQAQSLVQKTQDAQDLEQQIKDGKRQATELMVQETLRKDIEEKETEAINEHDSDGALEMLDTDGIPIDDDETYVDSELAQEAWKIREIERLLRDKKEQKTAEEEVIEIERRRKLTEAEREAENLKLGTDATERKEGVAYNFMQKYHHKGAFFQSNGDLTDASMNELFNRDFNMPTGEDKMDKSVLPAVLQKRQGTFGKKGNSKWTHLTNEDTTTYDPLRRVSENISFRFQQKQAGYKGMNSLDRPSYKRKRI